MRKVGTLHKPRRTSAERIDKSRQRLVVPCGTTNPRFMVLPTFVCHECYEEEQPQQRWGCSRNGQVRPLPLRFHAQVSSNLFKRHLELPALYEEFQDLSCTEQQIRAEQRLGGELPFRIANQHPANGRSSTQFIVFNFSRDQ